VGRSQELKLSAGWFHEHGTGTERARAQAEWDHGIINRKGKNGLSLRGILRSSAYSSGDRYNVARVDVSLGRGNNDVFTEVGARLNGVAGETPFLWDEVQVRTELFGAKRIALGAYRLEGVLRYDVNRDEFYDMQIAVAKRLKCLEPEIRYSTRRAGVTFNLKVYGFGPEADQPAQTP
jgi:hypothetical protein